MTRVRNGAKAITWDVSELIRYDDDTTVCVHLTPRQIIALLGPVSGPMSWSTRWFNAPSEQFPRNFSWRLANDLLAYDTCQPRSQHIIIRKRLPDCIRLEDTGNEINLSLEDCMTPINVYINECCCGGSPAAPAPAAPAAGSGLIAGASRCDIVTTIVPYYISQVREWLVQIDSAMQNGATLLEALTDVVDDSVPLVDVTPATLETIAEYLRNSLDGFLAVLEDTDMILRAQENAWGRFSQEFYSDFGRGDIINLAQSLPVLWGQALSTGTVSPRALAEVLARFQPIDKFAQRLQIARGTANANLCEYLASQYGQSYTPPVAPIPYNSLIAQVGGFDYYVINNNFDIAVSGDEYTFSTLSSPESWLISAINSNPACSGANSSFQLYDSDSTGVATMVASGDGSQDWNTNTRIGPATFPDWQTALGSSYPSAQGEITPSSTSGSVPWNATDYTMKGTSVQSGCYPFTVRVFYRISSS